MTIHQAIDLARFWFPLDRKRKDQVHHLALNQREGGAWGEPSLPRSCHAPATLPPPPTGRYHSDVSGAASRTGAARRFCSTLSRLVVGRAGRLSRGSEARGGGGAQRVCRGRVCRRPPLQGSRSSHSTLPKRAWMAPSTRRPRGGAGTGNSQDRAVARGAGRSQPLGAASRSAGRRRGNVHDPCSLCNKP